MDAEVIALLGGLLFLLLALVGGGFTVKEIIMPTIPRWARAASLFVGVTLVVLSLVSFDPRSEETPVTEAGATASTPAATPEVSVAPAPGFPVQLPVDSTESTAADDGIEVSGLRASAQSVPVGVGAQILVEFTLENVGTAPVTFQETFIGRRTPGDDWADTADENQGLVLEPGETVPISATVPFDEPGSWKLWPCYTLADGDWCPDEWQRFFVTVE